MNAQNISLLILAFIALGAVFAFILILGGPELDNPTGQVASSKFYLTTTRYYNQYPYITTFYNTRDAEQACAQSMCSNGVNGRPTGRYDPIAGLYECYCFTTFDDSPVFPFWRSVYHK